MTFSSPHALAYFSGLTWKRNEEGGEKGGVNTKHQHTHFYHKHHELKMWGHSCCEFMQEEATQKQSNTSSNIVKKMKCEKKNKATLSGWMIKHLYTFYCYIVLSIFFFFPFFFPTCNHCLTHNHNFFSSLKCLQGETGRKKFFFLCVTDMKMRKTTTSHHHREFNIKMKIKKNKRESE